MRWDTFIGRVTADGHAEDLFGDAAPRSLAGSAGEGAIVAIDHRGETERLAPAGSARAAVWELAARHGLDPRYPAEVLREVDASVADPGLEDPALVDRRDVPFVTIDGATARDLDQAVHVAERPEGGWTIRYALADAAFYAPPRSALFAEALRRGATYYLPGLAIPMMPRALSEGLVSLNPAVDRRALVFVLRLDASGELEATATERARVRSRAKLSFEAVQAHYDRNADPALEDAVEDAIAASLDALRAAGEARMRLAEERHLVRYRRAEVRIGTEDDLRGFVTREDLRLDVERYNEQVSLLCNVAGARLLREAGEPYVEPIFRVHPAPPSGRVADFEELSRAVAKAQHLDPARWVWRRESGRPLAAFLRELPQEGREGRIAAALHRQAIMLNVRSTFQEEPEGHHGVGAEVYARFTSPMREVVGIHVHHELFEHLEGRGTIDEVRRERVIEAANRARMKQKVLENEANALVLDQLLGTADRAGESLAGTLMGLDHHKAHVRLDEPPIDVKAYLGHQARFGGPAEVDQRRTTLTRGDQVVARLGDPVELRVHGRDGERWVLEVVARG